MLVLLIFPMPETTVILDATAIQRALTRIAHEIVERNENGVEVVLVGIPTGGVPLAQRLGKILAEIWKHAVPTGSLDVSMHRDNSPHPHAVRCERQNGRARGRRPVQRSHDTRGDGRAQ
jgi:pyrimidine operon attenuation protein/uracil phosphoribosyltransferase